MQNIWSGRGQKRWVFYLKIKFVIFPNTFVEVADNTGVKRLKCIRVYNKQNKGLPGDVLLVVVHKVTPHKKLKAGDKMKAVVVLLVLFFLVRVQ